MKRTAALALFSAVLITAAPARADLCAVDHAPAATLLLPYFEVDLANPAGRTTLFSVNNAGDKSVLAHVVLWTDLAVPTLAFDVYLTGYDVQTINLRDIFTTGTLPRTADKDRDPSDIYSPQGQFSFSDVSFPGCEGLPPQPLPASLADSLQRAHSGRPSSLFQNQCAGVDRNQPQVVRGYVTVDVVKRCTTLRPSDPGYFGSDGVAGFDNVLWGDFFQVDPGGRFAQGDGLVRIEARPGGFGPGSRTFYGRYVQGSGADGREPLATAWASRYLNGGPFDGGTDLIAWRSVPWAGSSFPCGTRPAGFPQAQQELFAFDEEENVQLANQTFPGIPPPVVILTPFPGAANRVRIGGPDLPVPFDFGWLLLDLAPFVNAPPDPYAQGWVGQVSSAQGRFSVGFQSTHLGDLCAADRCPGGLPVAAGQLCVQPTAAGQPAHFTVTPQGCFSPLCTEVVHAGCAVEHDGPDFRLDALVCLQPRDSVTCAQDCSGGGTARCDSGALAPGIYTARLGALALTFQVPSATATCVGTPPG
jgi:hypothetical protein